MSLRQLRALKDEVDQAIRAAIRKKQSAALPSPVAAKSTDLESERDAWLAKRQGTSRQQG